MEPTVALFQSIVAQYDLAQFDAIIAAGGGSVLDTAKALAVVHSFGGDIRDYAGFNKVPGVPRIPVIAVPTTAGTGSEVSDGSVLIDEENDTKFLVISKDICPTEAITDPLMTVSMPPSVTALSGTDALVHATESYISKGASPASELFALRAIELISSNIKAAYANGKDIAVRENMQIGATMAMTAAMNSKLGLCHAMAMPLCGLYHMPHGQAVGMTLPAVLRYNAAVAEEKIRTVLSVMGFMTSAAGGRNDLMKALNSLQSFLEDIGITFDLNAFGYKERHMETLQRETMNSAQRPTNPRDPSMEDIAHIVGELRP